MAEGEVCILRSPGIAASSISLLSMGGICGRSLAASGGENYSPLWKANMLSLFSIMTLWSGSLKRQLRRTQLALTLQFCL